MEEFTKQKQEKLSFQPVPPEQLEKTPRVAELLEKNKQLLTLEKRELCEQHNNEIKDEVAIHAQIRNAVKSSTRDVESAIKTNKRKLEAAQKQAEKAEQKRKEAEATAALPKPPPQKSRKLTILGMSMEDSSLQQVTVFDTLPESKKADGSEPFIIKMFEPLRAFIEQNQALRCQLVNFGNQFLQTAQCKSTGRAQCPLKGEDLQKHTESIFSTLAPWAPKGGQSASWKSVQPYLHTALFGFSADMQYYGFEEKALAQVRYLSQGSRKVFLMGMHEVMDCMEQHPASVSDVLHAWTAFKVEDESHKSKIFCATESPGSVLYVPAGWLIAEATLNGGFVVGLRRSLLPPPADQTLNTFDRLLPVARTQKSLTGHICTCVDEARKA